MTETKLKKECPFCGGTGQWTSFQGVSRFLLSWEECPECGGLGFLIENQEAEGRVKDDETFGNAKKDK